MSATGRHDRHDGHETSPPGAAEGPPERAVDPRAVRVTIGPAMPHVALDPLVAEPPPIPVAPIPSVVGRGLLGGRADLSGAGPTAASAPGLADLVVDGAPIRATVTPLGAGRVALVVEDPDGAVTRQRVLLEPVEAPLDGRGAVRREVIVDGWRIELDVASERRAALRDRARRGREESAHGGPTEVHAIIPGRIVSVSVAAGDAVVASQQLLVVEAMKMQNELHAPRDGTVTKVAVAPGETIEIGDLLLVLE